MSFFSFFFRSTRGKRGWGLASSYFGRQLRRRRVERVVEGEAEADIPILKSRLGMAHHQPPEEFDGGSIAARGGPLVDGLDAAADDALDGLLVVSEDRGVQDP